jgi:hypothetical protein
VVSFALVGHSCLKRGVVYSFSLPNNSMLRISCIMALFIFYGLMTFFKSLGNENSFLF